MAEVDPTHEAHAGEAAAHAEAAHQHHPPTGFIRKYIFSIDHKVIGIQYLLLAIFSAFMGMFMSVLMRIKLTWPNEGFSFLETILHAGAPGGKISPEMYVSLVN